MPLFCFAKQAADMPDFWVTFIMYCLTNAAVENECQTLAAWIQHATSHCDMTESADVWEKGWEMTQTTTCGLWNTLIQRNHCKWSNTIQHRRLKGGWLCFHNAGGWREEEGRPEGTRQHKEWRRKTGWDSSLIYLCSSCATLSLFTSRCVNLLHRDT